MGGSEEYVMESFVTADKIGTLVHSLLSAEAWKEKLFPKISKHVAKLSSFKSYMCVYHEASIMNLLEVLLFHRTAIKWWRFSRWANWLLLQKARKCTSSRQGNWKEAKGEARPSRCQKASSSYSSRRTSEASRRNRIQLHYDCTQSCSFCHRSHDRTLSSSCPLVDGEQWLALRACAYSWDEAMDQNEHKRRNGEVGGSAMDGMATRLKTKAHQDWSTNLAVYL